MRKLIRVIELDGLEREVLVELEGHKTSLIKCLDKRESVDAISYFDGFLDGLQQSGIAFRFAIAVVEKISVEKDKQFESGNFKVVDERLVFNDKKYGRILFFKKEGPRIHLIKISNMQTTLIFEVKENKVTLLLANENYNYPNKQFEGYSNCLSHLSIESVDYDIYDLDILDSLDLCDLSDKGRVQDSSFYLGDIFITELIPRK